MEMPTLNDIKDNYISQVCNKLEKIYFGKNMEELKHTLFMDQEVNKFVFEYIGDISHFEKDLAEHLIRVILSYYKDNRFKLRSNINDYMYKEAKDPKEEDFIRAYVLAEAAAGPYKDLLSFDINPDLNLLIPEAARLSRGDFNAVKSKLFESEEATEKIEETLQNIYLDDNRKAL